MKKIIYTLAVLAVAGASVHAQEFDDIYYNPKKDNNKATESKTKKSNYIADFSSVDVDEYNRRGQYYESPIDTIGVSAESGEDFVYTQKIQKFYNPTIVVDNAAVLMDVLDNSYGNVEVVFDNGYPSFNSIYGWPGYYSSYAWYPTWRWSPGFSWSWSPVWGWEWYPSWSIGPSWSWGPGLNHWGYNSWAWGPYWYPAYNPGWGWGGWGRPYYADYRPNGRGLNYAGAGWASNTRPGGNAGHATYNRPGGYSGVNKGNNVNTAVNYHRGSTGSYGAVANRVNSGNTAGSNRNSYTIGSDGHRRYGTTTNTGTSNRYNGTTTNGSHRTQSTTNSSSYRNNNAGSSRSSSSYNSGQSGSSHRSSGGGSYGGSRSSGGSGRGRR